MDEGGASNQVIKSNKLTQKYIPFDLDYILRAL